jgi:hypothetical protein
VKGSSVIFFDIEIDGRGAGGFGVGGHLQFFVGGGLKLGAQQGWRQEEGEKNRETE